MICLLRVSFQASFLGPGGFYVLRTNMPAEALNTADTVRAYKSLGRVERAFRCLKTTDLDIGPIFHWLSPRVRAANSSIELQIDKAT
jgi:transposase